MKAAAVAVLYAQPMSILAQAKALAIASNDDITTLAQDPVLAATEWDTAAVRFNRPLYDELLHLSSSAKRPAKYAETVLVPLAIVLGLGSGRNLTAATMRLRTHFGAALGSGKLETLTQALRRHLPPSIKALFGQRSLRGAYEQHVDVQLTDAMALALLDAPTLTKRRALFPFRPNAPTERCSDDSVLRGLQHWCLQQDDAFCRDHLDEINRALPSRFRLPQGVKRKRDDDDESSIVEATEVKVPRLLEPAVMAEIIS